MDFTYTLANCGHAPDLRSKITEGQKQCCIHLPVEHQEALTKYPWDDKDSLGGLDEASIGHFAKDDNNPSGAPNNQAGIYS
jgi:hypothetical protein